MIPLPDIIAALSGRIGPRPAGSAAEAEAAEVITGFVRTLGLPVRLHPFAYRGWSVADGSAVQFERGPGRVAASTLPYTFATGADGIRGTVVAAGVKQIIRTRFACECFLLEDPSGRSVGRVLVDRHGALRPLANPSLYDALPTVVVGQALRSQLVQASHDREPATIWTAGSERLQEGNNLIVDLDDSTRKIVVVAHYDTVPGSPGANDNASGVAVALGLLSRFASRRVPLRFVFAAAEELMFVGSRAFVADPREPLAEETTLACLAIDTVGAGGPLILRAGSDSVWATLGRRQDRQIGIVAAVAASDHWSFHEAGIPSAQLTRLGDENIHSAADIAGNVADALVEESLCVSEALLSSALNWSSGFAARP